MKIQNLLLLTILPSCARELDYDKQKYILMLEKDKVLENYVSYVIENNTLNEEEKKEYLELSLTEKPDLKRLEELNNKMSPPLSQTVNKEPEKPKPDKRERIMNNIKEKATKRDGFKPLNVQWEKNPGVAIQELNKVELSEKMKNEGFVNIDGYDLYMLRRIWLAYKYDQFFWDVHEETGFPVSVLYSYFIIEATVKGVESNLMRNYMNPGGVKYRGDGKKAKAYDDCFNSKGKPVPCDFSVYETYEDMVTGWSKVFNNKRYQKCKSEKNARNICKCLYKSGYHTGNNWSQRAEISKGYWILRLSFPR